MKGSRSGFVTLWAAVVLNAAIAQAASPVVEVQSGKLSGTEAGGVESWKDIPFAAPPTGSYRWRAPQPVKSWKGLRDATHYGHDCMQLPFPSDAAPLGTLPAEDCLYANVWRPTHAGQKLPVIFWIYGGGFVNGGASPPTYSGANLAKQGALVFSANYRVGRFGTFAHPQLTRENADRGMLGNYGYMDQLAALNWVHRNIAAFGGDPDNVTLVGESAGGMSVHMLVTAPLARGLFHKAVVMSGGNGSPMGGPDLASVEKIGVEFAAAKGIAADDPDTLIKLRALSAEQVTSGLNMTALFNPGPRTFAGPYVDGTIAVDAVDAYRKGAFAKVPMMIGATSADMGGRTGFMLAGARSLSAEIAARGVPVYAYRFSYVAGSSGLAGAQHATEIPFFFDTQAIKYAGQTTARDNSMGKTISAYLVNFARTGNPNGAGLPEWPRYSRATDEIIDFAESGKAVPQKDPWGAEIDAAAQSVPPVADKPGADTDVRARADALLAKMTPEEKAGQITQYFDFGDPAESKRVVDEVIAGRAGSLLFVYDPAEIDRLQHTAVERTRLKLPLLFGFDVIHGFRTIMPVPLAMAASWDPKTAEDGQTVAAAEARAAGLHWAFAPMVDIARDPRWGRIVEGAGEDPYLGAAMAAAQVRGFQGDYIGSPGHLIAGPKHFAGYGTALGGRDYDEANVSDNELWNVYLPPFKAAIDAGAGNLMSAYMALNGVPPAGNRWLLTDVLRKQWGFKGFIVTDAGAAHDLLTHEFAESESDAAVRALQAGVDMEMSPPFGTSVFKTLPQALAGGTITSAELDTAARRILEAKIRMGLLERPYVDLQQAQRVLADPAHRVVSRVAAERSAVLLRNERGLLPLDAGKLKSIAVVGPLADSARDILGPWVFAFDLRETVTILAGIKSKVGSSVRVEYSPGVTMPARLHPSIFDMNPAMTAKRVEVDDARELPRAVGLAKASDVTVLVLGEAQNMIGEQASRSSLDLPGRQQELLEAVIATGKPVVVLLMTARPLDLKNARPNALMNVWYPGTQGGTAVANLLFGTTSPGGKLPYTWPRDLGQIPLTYAHLRSHQPKTSDQRYWNEPNSPLYPFGFGLSYSTFEFSNLRLDRNGIAPGESISVSVDVRNTGNRVADEVAQLYIHQRYGTSARPVRELKGFRRVTLKPGEARTIGFALTPAELSYWTAAKHAWVQDESTFDVYVGSSSQAALTSSFEVGPSRR